VVHHPLASAARAPADEPTVCGDEVPPHGS
jgi:hypothetical protein